MLYDSINYIWMETAKIEIIQMQMCDCKSCDIKQHKNFCFYAFYGIQRIVIADQYIELENKFNG